jgi:hypothetical protein
MILVETMIFLFGKAKVPTNTYPSDTRLMDFCSNVLLLRRLIGILLEVLGIWWISRKGDEAFDPR